MNREWTTTWDCICFQGGKYIYCLCHNKEPLGKCLVLLLGKGGCSASAVHCPLCKRGKAWCCRPQAHMAEDTITPEAFCSLTLQSHFLISKDATELSGSRTWFVSKQKSPLWSHFPLTHVVSVSTQSMLLPHLPLSQSALSLHNLSSWTPSSVRTGITIAYYLLHTCGLRKWWLLLLKPAQGRCLPAFGWQEAEKRCAM